MTLPQTFPGGCSPRNFSRAILASIPPPAIFVPLHKRRDSRSPCSSPDFSLSLVDGPFEAPVLVRSHGSLHLCSPPVRLSDFFSFLSVTQPLLFLFFLECDASPLTRKVFPCGDRLSYSPSPSPLRESTYAQGFFFFSEIRLKG